MPGAPALALRYAAKPKLLKIQIGVFLSKKTIESEPWRVMYRNGVLFVIGGFLAAVAFFVSGWTGFLNHFGEPPSSWFQRSGSLMTITMVFVDYHLYKLVNDVRQINQIPPSALQIKDRYHPLIRVLPYFAVLFTAVATFVWGYGDILFSEIRQF
ncbi:hypothetical protein AVO41_05930 [Thiomicrospira sp. WB1]|nr:hypothetical protein AVO41_05930 [Thiomicrospira sp. WB1]